MWHAHGGTTHPEQSGAIIAWSTTTIKAIKNVFYDRRGTVQFSSEMVSDDGAP